jgi:amino-acid N-acetyltransferase
MFRLTNLREILRYVPRFRDRVFVIAIDGAVVEDDNFPNILLDISLLRSLNIRVALVHGAAAQIQRYAAELNITPSNIDGTGITDPATLNIAITAANRVTHEILEGLSANDLRGACPNALVAHPAGILNGIDHRHTGRVERVDVDMLDALMKADILPVIPPIGCDGVGASYRLNSDAVAVEIAKALRAVKLIYLTTEGGIQTTSGQVIRQMTTREADEFLKKNRGELSSEVVTKLNYSIRAGQGGIERIHIIDGREEEGLLSEVFSNEGIGTLIYTNEYEAIRPAQKKDVRAVYTLISHGVQADELVKRTRADIERQILDYFVYEVDKTTVACIALHAYPEVSKAEMASVYVDNRYENKGIGRKLMTFAEGVARSRGFEELFCLSTQAVNYFIQKGNFTLGTKDDLPPTRREAYDKNKRQSAVLLKKLQSNSPSSSAS